MGLALQAFILTTEITATLAAMLMVFAAITIAINALTRYLIRRLGRARR